MCVCLPVCVCSAMAHLVKTEVARFYSGVSGSNEIKLAYCTSRSLSAQQGDEGNRALACCSMCCSPQGGNTSSQRPAEHTVHTYHEGRGQREQYNEDPKNKKGTSEETDRQMVIFQLLCKCEYFPYQISWVAIGRWRRASG